MSVQLVNVQSNSEFASHMLNRDVWREETVKNIIKVGFVLYQVRDPSAAAIVFAFTQHVLACHS